MSELKVHKAYNRWIDEEMPTPNDDLICNEFYLKSEADKVIAELEERIADGDNDFDMANSQNERLLKIVRRYKYKRAIDKAKWCEAESWILRNTPLWEMFSHEVWQHDDEFWQRWHERWLELAEKFKETK